MDELPVLTGFLRNFYAAKRRKQKVSAVAMTAIDPQKVAMEARAYQDAQRKAGHEISATDAVAHVIAEQRTR